MKTEFQFIPVLLLALAVSANAQTVPALVNYQGRLANPDGTALATGDYQLTFRVYDSATNSGGLVWGPQMFDGVAGQGHGAKIPVVQGYFNVMLGPVDTNGVSLDSAFTSSNRFVEITITNRLPILPRQQILSAPFAFNSAKLAGYDWSAVFGGTNDPVNGKIPGTKLANGSVTAQQLASNTISVQHLANNQVWLAGGNAGTSPGANFIGTTDNQVLDIKVNGNRAFRFAPSGDPDRPNLIGGHAGNQISGAVGATISGGGAASYLNQISGGSFGFIGGGIGNSVTNDYGTVGGGLQNTSGQYGTTGGGLGNNASGLYSTVGGGVSSTASGERATVGGGNGNDAGGTNSVVGGGRDNDANGQFSTIPGGNQNVALGNYSFAAGNQAQALNPGTFVWADSQGTPFTSTTSHQFLIRASGGVGIGKNNPATALDVNGTITATSFSGSGAGITGLNLTNMAARQVGTSVGIGGVAMSLPIAFQRLQGGSFQDITNLTVIIQTTGRPVMAMVVPSPLNNYSNSPNSTLQSGFVFNPNSGNNFGCFRLVRNNGDGAIVTFFGTGAGGASAVGYPSAIGNFVDLPPSGTHTYKLQWGFVSGGGNVYADIYNSVLVIFEL